MKRKQHLKSEQRHALVESSKQWKLPWSLCRIVFRRIVILEIWTLAIQWISRRLKNQIDFLDFETKQFLQRKLEASEREVVALAFALLVQLVLNAGAWVKLQKWQKYLFSTMTWFTLCYVKMLHPGSPEENIKFLCRNVRIFECLNNNDLGVFKSSILYTKEFEAPDHIFEAFRDFNGMIYLLCYHFKSSLKTFINRAYILLS